MRIELKQVTVDTFQECIGLSVTDEQRDFCASNLYSIAESKVEPLAIPTCIFIDNQMVGFILYGPDNSDDGMYMALDRFMIDKRFQGKGYGKSALVKLIDIIKNDFPEYKEITLSFNPENIASEKLFTGFGFVKTGKFSGDECIATLTL